MYYSLFKTLPTNVDVGIFVLMHVYVVLCIFLSFFDLFLIYFGRTRQRDFEAGDAPGLFLPFMFFAFFVNVITVMIAGRVQAAVAPPGHIVAPVMIDLSIMAVFAVSFFVKLFIVNKMNTKPSSFSLQRDAIHMTVYIMLFYFVFLIRSAYLDAAARNLLS